MVTLEPITTGELPALAEYLRASMNPKKSIPSWMAPFEANWSPDWPNHGFKLVDDERTVGVFEVIYSQRDVRGRSEVFGNLVNWWVDVDYRGGKLGYSLKMLEAIIEQEDCHFFATTPGQNVLRIYAKYGFSFPPTGRWIAPCVPSLYGAKVSERKDEIRNRLDGTKLLKLFSDHEAIEAVHIAMLEDGTDFSLFIWRPHIIRRFLRCAWVLYVSDPDCFVRAQGAVARFLLRKGYPAFQIEKRYVRRPRFSVERSGAPTAFYSRTLSWEDMNNSYSELMF